MAAKKTAPKKTAPKKVAKKTALAKQIRFDSVADLRGYIQEAVEQESYRMVPREVAAAAQAAAEPEEADAPDESLATWRPTPAVLNQLDLHPTSVRFKAVVTEQFVMSDEKSRTEFNKLQVRMHPPGAPQVKIISYEREFAPAISSFVILVSHSEIEYQQI